jgi:hypothetical protein
MALLLSLWDGNCRFQLQLPRSAFVARLKALYQALPGAMRGGQLAVFIDSEAAAPEPVSGSRARRRSSS